jgi:CRISPR-associated protein Csb2
MGQHLVLTVNLHDRFHGMVEGGSEWPPAPARVFQALVAGAARGRSLPQDKLAAFEWLESLPPPVISAPRAQLGTRVVLFVPNNDADSLSDPTDVGAIRTKKVVQPRIPTLGPLVYAWPIEADSQGHAIRIINAANDLYQLGRGVDMAWASGEVLEDDALDEYLVRFDAEVHTPGAGRHGVLACPARGTLKSLIVRYTAPRLTVEGTGQKTTTYFTNAPKPFFVGVAYIPDVQRHLFDLRRVDSPDLPAPGRPSAVAQIVERIRDAAAQRLQGSMPEHEAAIFSCLVGRRPDGTGAGRPEHRVRIVPLLSIGHEHADRGVRRVLVEIPSGAPLRAADVTWAFTGLDVMDPGTGEIRAVLTPSEDWSMLRKHYLPKAQCWRSVTPLALPEGAARRRIEPTRRVEEAKGGAERAGEEVAAAGAVAAALRHAGIRARATSIKVQREPFEGRGQRAEAFERKPRFPKERLWHVEIAFDVPVEGPLVLGDGRFLGLGLMAPARDVISGVQAFAITGGLVDQSEPLEVTRALRRAVMARVQAVLGMRERLTPFFSGHAEDGAPIRRSHSSHLSFAFEPDLRRVLVLAPHVVERRSPTVQELEHLRTLAAALEAFTQLRAGHAGSLALSPAIIGEGDDSFLGSSRLWKTITPYVVTRHSKRGAAMEALVENVRAECRRLGLTPVEVEVSDVRGAPGVGLTGNVTLLFDRNVAGPLLLGRTRYLGGGLFRPGSRE